MRLLHLIRHAPALADGTTEPDDWILEPDVEKAIKVIASGLGASMPRRIVSSRQQRAADTGRILASSLSVPLEIRDGLEEHHRLTQDFIVEKDAFETVLAGFFKHSEQSVFGQESASCALKRFKNALVKLMSESDQDEIVVSHGTVISLLLSDGGNGAPFDIWSSLKSPEHVVVSWPSLKRVNV